jgi:hypothetical protein
MWSSLDCDDYPSNHAGMIRPVSYKLQRCNASLDSFRERLMHEPFGPLNCLHTLSLLAAPIKTTRLLNGALG